MSCFTRLLRRLFRVPTPVPEPHAMTINAVPNAKAQFVDLDGAPLAGGTVGMYIVATLTPKNTWQDPAQGSLNINPIELDARGQASIFGTGLYRQIVKDADGGLIWDRVTQAPSIIDSASFIEYVPISGGDDTAVLQAALDAGGAVYLNRGVYLYTNLTVSKTVRIIGASEGIDGTLGATHLTCTLADASTKITVGDLADPGLWSVNFENIGFTAPNASGGRLLQFNNCFDPMVENCEFFDLHNTEIAIATDTVNTMRFRNVRIDRPTRAGFYLEGADGHDTDIVDFDSVIVAGDSLGAGTHIPACIERNGTIQGITGRNVLGLQGSRGLYLHNAIGSTRRSEFISIYDLEIEWPKYECIRNEWGNTLRLTDGYFHGSLTTHNIVIATGTTFPNDDISFIGGKCDFAFHAGMYLDGRDIRIMGMDITGNGQAASDTYPGIDIGPDAYNVTIGLNNIGERLGYLAASQNYAVLIEDGAQQITVANNNLNGNLTGTIHNLADSDNSNFILGPNLGDPTPGSITYQTPATGFTITLGRGAGQHNVSFLSLQPAALLATGTVDLDTNPIDLQQVTVFSSQTVTALTVDPGAGKTVTNSPTTILANGSFTLSYNADATTWIRIR